ncbi:Ribonuclease HII [Candidatus Cyrtobacter comes]|uniref:Ribonuclease n=1 Tax=Candidatus Cyrtobacter comes TaxID=675776 RepID=A0ABU5L8X4_9RICK|nr:ribonuclease HII [Candidatus Cyrtobacter comes]MDZ5762568.1 Ribonuclease HII [Candidatus Cyrtobacter comes]
MIYTQIIGVDEVGRGPLAGPVVAVAVVLTAPIPTIKDSKALSKKNIQYFARILKNSCEYSIGEASVEEIEQHNILGATMLAMRRAIFGIHNYSAKKILIDGNQNPLKYYPQLNSDVIVKGDSIVESISAASIIAKDYRDDLMSSLCTVYPEYYWSKNSGYGTKEHINAIIKNGLTKYHRVSFCKKIVISQ